ncbi:polysaccharide biosynthesis/export family protein [Bordetella pseudohinzii]|uniref:Capsular biosynthesis protein n=2 Tax=Bordetella pseudohinzii TaxID=1331258 RepID=A0ABM6DBR4_9BORD|nr:polysaccharide biosynthesis/export family protein [Bordetella pseudohinzii]ANY15037.1 capsular biosynthesis protein [Bordetella pseudohinzii]KXA79848.1 capsular biosynthesis protein [Bordetella pseudohinzii]KXA82810.1 capsular biosynthesis protein [Bordetella pseudohinzii]
MNIRNNLSKVRLIFSGVLLALVLTGCGTMPGWLSASGASREQVMDSRDSRRIEGIELVDVNDTVARRLAANRKQERFSDLFRAAPSNNNYLIGPGDVIEVSIWETPPAVLFGTAVNGAGSTASPATTNMVTLPSQMVSSRGTITVPFAGHIFVQGRSTQEIEADVAKRLNKLAHEPQVMVRIVQNNTSSVTVVGEVTTSTSMSLTPKGERLLDALAAGGGVKQPVNRMSVQLSRENVTATMPLDLVIRDPRQNVMLKPGDVITALFQPQSFSVLGATGKNEEIAFEAQGISLAQALARSGGLNDNRADARGVFIFRFEDPKLIDMPDGTPRQDAALVPVVYQIDLRDPAAFFVTQNFPVQDRDVIYVSNSPAAEFDKFLRLIVSVAVPTVTLNRTFD